VPFLQRPPEANLGNAMALLQRNSEAQLNKAVPLLLQRLPEAKLSKAVPFLQRPPEAKTEQGGAAPPNALRRQN